MVGNMRIFHCFSCSRRLVSVVLATACFAVSVPMNIQALSPVTISNNSRDPDESSNAKFDQFQEEIEKVDDPIEYSRAFLRDFVDELNSTYGTELTVNQALHIVRENLDFLNFTDELKNIIINTIELVEIDQTTETNNFHTVAMRFNWPWKWNWTKAIDKNKMLYMSQTSIAPLLAAELLSPETELPGSIYSGQAEILAGALTCIIGTVYPPAWPIGVGLLLDGTRRLLNGSEELDKINLERQKQLDLSNPFSVNF
jgi:hypothetical protein